MESSSYINTAEKLEEKFWKEIESLGETIRKEVVLPVCKKHHLSFTSGMGRFFFSYIRRHGKVSQENNFSEREDFTAYSYPGIPRSKIQALKEDLVPILDILNHEVTRAQYLGYFVSDVKKEDYI